MQLAPSKCFVLPKIEKDQYILIEQSVHDMKISFSDYQFLHELYTPLYVLFML